MLSVTLFAVLGASARLIEQNITNFNERTFEKYVVQRPRHEVWFVLYQARKLDQEGLNLYAKFKNASDVSFGMIKFGVVDCDRYPTIKKDMNIGALPHIHIYHAEGDEEYDGKQKVRDFMKKCISFLNPNATSIVEEGWEKEALQKPSVILFTNATKQSAVWKGIANYYTKKPIRIGYCNNWTIAQTYNVSTLPTVMFMNGTNIDVFNGTFNFREVRYAIDQWFVKRVETPTQATTTETENTIFTPDEFANKCYGGKNLCILSVSKSPPDSFIKMQKEMAKHRTKLFCGVQGLPETFMNKGGVWIYNPRRDGFIHVADPANLFETMDRVIDGSAKWTKKSVLAEGNTEL